MSDLIRIVRKAPAPKPDRPAPVEMYGIPMLVNEGRIRTRWEDR